MRTSDEAVRKRFEDSVCPEPNSGCLLWLGNVNNDGYGQSCNRKQILAHRLAWLLAGNPLPPGMRVLHTCDVRCCVNVRHLYLGTQRDNGRDMMARRRGCKGASGLPYGVSKSKRRFRASVTAAGKTHSLGQFDTPEEAGAAAEAFRAAYLEKAK